MRSTLRPIALIFCAVLFVARAASAAAPDAATPVAPPIPASVPADAQFNTQFVSGTHAGDLASWRTPDGVRHEFYQYNDRGRGPVIEASYALDAAGIPTAVTISGVDYYKSPLTERFTVDGATANWRSDAEQGTSGDPHGRFYLSVNGPPSELALLVRAALAAGGTLRLLPAGSVSVSKLESRTVAAGGASQQVTLYSVIGLSFSPAYVWLDADGGTFLLDQGWFRLVRRGFEGVVEPLVARQRAINEARSGELAKQLGSKPAAVVFRDVTVFDSVHAKLVPHQTVIVQGERIVYAGGKPPAAPKGARVVAGAGKTLLPGLWDMHQHFADDDGLLDIANGVTGARDMANDIEQLGARIKRFDAGSEVGPTVVPAGFVDGRGPFQGPEPVFADTPEEARAVVARYHALGYPQVKIYSSMQPALVPVITKAAHALGMRVSGHIPAGMTAAEAVRDGYDEIQHINMIVLNFMPDVKETRTPARFHEPGKRAADLDPASAPVQEFFTLLVQHHITVDPTLSAFEGMYCARKGELSPDAVDYAARLPLQYQRGLRGGGLPVPDAATAARYCASFGRMQQFVKAMYDRGISLVAGTDALAGLAYHRELESYARLGIPIPELLRIATLHSATIARRDRELGSITAGKLASLLLVDGDPTTDLTRLRDPLLVMRTGTLYEPHAIDAALGISPP